MDTILVGKVVPRDGKKPWKVYDGNNIEYVTWDDTLGEQAQGFVGAQAQVEAEVTEKPGRDGTVFINRLLKEIQEVPKAEAPSSDYEPSVNTGKQVVIIRQNSWSQTNHIYSKAVELYQIMLGQGPDEVVLDMQAVHAIAWQLFSASKRPENSTMQTIAWEIEKLVRSDWFPITDDEIPF